MVNAKKASFFTDEYLVDLNGAQAAIRAGYSATGARQEGTRLQAKVDVQVLMEQKRQKIAARSKNSERTFSERACGSVREGKDSGG